MVFVPSMTSFVISDILGGGKLQLIGNIIEQEFTKSMNWYLGSGLSVSLMIFVLISMAFTMRNDMEGKGVLQYGRKIEKFNKQMLSWSDPFVFICADSGIDRAFVQ